MSDSEKESEGKGRYAPNLVREKIPEGLAGAAHLRKWLHSYRKEFNKNYARYCKPYRLIIYFNLLKHARSKIDKFNSVKLFSYYFKTNWNFVRIEFFCKTNWN